MIRKALRTLGWVVVAVVGLGICALPHCGRYQLARSGAFGRRHATRQCLQR